jgi:hypothetical protein
MIRPHAKYRRRERARSRSKNENDVLPYWALTRRVSAHNGQYLTSRLFTFRL